MPSALKDKALYWAQDPHSLLLTSLRTFSLLLFSHKNIYFSLLAPTASVTSVSPALITPPPLFQSSPEFNSLGVSHSTRRRRSPSLLLRFVS
ncbi:hypothetical protein L1987_00613 [Smallanthus sonchifolius]|uniref:Uncharacterized protein n=1 Tax=Smallanthus sonchifolius TaxID=185202 RepID=A0ACB9K2Z7_9ASTR|nr:hypothetical protein L1987_00613 [Smallanthus sonchifolius]